MTTPLQREIERWEADLEHIAEVTRSDDWFLEEQCFAEALHTVTAYRGRILPILANQRPQDMVLAHEIERLVDHLEDLRNDLYRTVHPPTSHEQVAETIASLRTLSRVALRLEQSLEDAR